MLPLGDVSSLMFCQGLVTTLLSWLFLGEALDLIDAGLLVTSVLGCACIAQPKLLIDYALGRLTDSFQVEQLLTGIKLAGIALFIQGVASTSIRGIKRDVHHTTITFYSALGKLLISN